MESGAVGTRQASLVASLGVIRVWVYVSIRRAGFAQLCSSAAVQYVCGRTQFVVYRYPSGSEWISLVFPFLCEILFVLFCFVLISFKDVS